MSSQEVEERENSGGRRWGEIWETRTDGNMTDDVGEEWCKQARWLLTSGQPLIVGVL